MYSEKGTESFLIDRVFEASAGKRVYPLLGAAEALLKASGSTWWPADRVEYERNLATIRAALSEEAFGAAWAKGQAMTLERAIADASKPV